MRPIEKAPSYVRNRMCSRCKGWIRLSRNAILIVCNTAHIAKDGGGRRLNRGMIVKIFGGGSEVKEYTMKFSRARRLLRPRIDQPWPIFSWVTRSQEQANYDSYRLTDAEWMIATAIMYYLEMDRGQV